MPAPESSLETSPEPTPWPTGLTVTLMVAAVSAATDLALSGALRATYGWLWIPGNVVLVIGLAPTVWLLRTEPVWRWVAYGITAGLGVAWVGLALGVLLRAGGVSAGS